MINVDRLKKTFLDLLAINSLSTRERLVADYLIAKFAELGLKCIEDDAAQKIGGNAGNIIVDIKGSVANAKKILLSAHIDTVDSTNSLKVIFEDGIFKSDGTTILGADDKAGVAAIIEGVTSIIEDKTPVGDLQLVFDVSEETGLLGIRHLDKSLINSQMCYVFDTQKPVGGVTVSAPFHANLLIEIEGKAAHAGMAPEDGINAIVVASNAISKMKLGRIDFETTSNIGVINGGKARNIVADLVSIKAEARSRDEAKLDAQIDYIKKLFESEAEAIGAKAKVEVDKEYFGFRWTEDDDIVKLAVKASKRIGINPGCQEGGGGSDANVLNSAGIPAVVVGVGYEGAHGNTENIALDDLLTAAKFAESLIKCAAEG